MIVAAWLLAALLAATPEAPITNEEVVRRVVAGESVEAILADVRRRPPAFDVSEEMLAELRRAGVPQALLSAMIARAKPAAEPLPQPSPAPAAELRLRPSDEALSVQRLLGPQLVAELELPAGALQADALALAVLCGTTGHKDASPLRWPEGRVPERFAKHRLLAFLPAVEAGRSGKRLRVALGPSVTVPLDADLSHDLVVAVVVRAGGDWAVLGAGEMHGVRATAGSFATADLRLRDLPGGLLRVSVRRPVDAALPELPRSLGWARGASFASHGGQGRGVALSPDGRKRLLVGRDDLKLEIEGRAALDLAWQASGDTEILWSPDSKVFAVTSGSPAGSKVEVWRIEVDDAVHALPLRDALASLPTERLAAVAFPEEGSRLLLVARDQGRLLGYLLRTADGTLASRYTELEVRARWRDRLGPRLR